MGRKLNAHTYTYIGTNLKKHR